MKNINDVLSEEIPDATWKYFDKVLFTYFGGSLHICIFEGKYYWSIDNPCDLFWNEIPESLYDELLKHYNKVKLEKELE